MSQVENNPVLPNPPLSGEPRGVASWASSLTKTLASVLSRFAVAINAALDINGKQGMAQPLRLATFTTTTLPTASSWTGAIIYVSDGAAGQKFRGSDGSAWVNLG